MFSFLFREKSTAIVAQVEPMKKAISYHRAVKIDEIFVIPGQTVKPGDMLVKVERPDLVLDAERKNNDLQRLNIDHLLKEKKLIDRTYRAKVDKDAQIRKIDAEIAQLKVAVENNKELSRQFRGLAGFSDTVEQSGQSYSEIELDVLVREKELVAQQYELETQSDRRIFEEETKTYKILVEELESEISALMQEESELVKRADIHGTIGNVNVQTGELLSPYTTILSIYESKPTMIKAFMNEGFKYSMEVGKSVEVESSNREYSIEGKVSEIGARIIEYPERLKTQQNMKMWGQELFIKIPEDNRFINGERVFVIIKE